MTQHKRILIVSYYFAPQNLIGAVRPTKIAKYLSRMGHEVTVICGAGRDGKIDPTLERDMQELKDVRVLTEWNPLRAWYMKKQNRPKQPVSAAASAAAPEKKSGLKKLIFRAADAAYMYLYWLSDRSFSRMGRRELKKLTGTYDAVFSTYAPFSVHEIAQKARKSGLAKKWIADFRDEVGMSFRFQEGRRQRYMRMLRRDADILSAVSQGFLEMMRFDDVGRVLSNGYDREDLPALQPEAADRRLRLVYCGQFHMGRKGVKDRDLTPAFRALARLVQEGLIRKEEIRLVYAGGEGTLMRSYAAACDLEDCVEDHGQVSREESIRLQKGADILLLASWHMAAQKGILTGKLFEYMMMDKPILCCMNGDLPGSGIRLVLEETGIGLCREETSAAEDDEKLLSYTRSLVEKWKMGEELLNGQNRAAVEAYAYPQLAQVLSDWMSE